MEPFEDELVSEDELVVTKLFMFTHVISCTFNYSQCIILIFSQRYGKLPRAQKVDFYN